VRFSTLPSSTPYKLVLVVRMDLHMRSGKIAAQVAHAAVGTVLQLQEDAVHARSAGIGAAVSLHQANGVTALRAWLHQGQAKVVLQVRDQAEMHELERRARAQGVSTHIVADAGRTQVASGSETVLAVGPAPVHIVDAITGHLKLL